MNEIQDILERLAIRKMRPDGSSFPVLVREDGSHSSELLMGVSDERLNGGRETVIPTINQTNASEMGREQAILAALMSNRRYRSFDTPDEGTAFAIARSNAGGRMQGDLGIEKVLSLLAPARQAPPKQDVFAQPVSLRLR